MTSPSTQKCHSPQEFIKQASAHSSSPFWMGLSRRKPSHPWLWEDGSPLKPHLWVSYSSLNLLGEFLKVSFPPLSHWELPSYLFRASFEFSFPNLLLIWSFKTRLNSWHKVTVNLRSYSSLHAGLDCGELFPRSTLQAPVHTYKGELFLLRTAF